MKHDKADRGHEHRGESGEMPHNFDDVVLWIERLDGPERDVWQQPEHVVERMAIQPGMIVAEIGAGTGYFMRYLSRAVGPAGKVLALDANENLVAHMEQRAKNEGLLNVFPKRISSDDPGFLPHSVDRVLIVNTWHHCSERPAYAAKLKQALKPGGAVCVIDFDPHSEKGPPREFKLDKEQIAEELRAGGMEVEFISTDLTEQYMIRAR